MAISIYNHLCFTLYIFLLKNIFLTHALFAQIDLLERLQALEGIEVIEIEAVDEFQRTFQIDVTQPVDHNNPNGQQFTQRVYLNHNDEFAPMVFLPSGYSVSKRSVQEIALLYHTNHIAVARRYMNGSIPDPIDWQYLTIEQTAADHHRIVTLFKQIYSRIWISSGRSLSGLTALCHRRFYPQDVEGTISYSTPLMFSTTDPRFDQFLNEVGNEYSRNTIIQFQRTVLTNREEIIPLLTQYLINLGFGYSIGADTILEFIVLEYPFYFWSYGNGDVSAIPDSTAPPFELLNALLDVVDGFEYTDYGNDYYKSVYYQLYTEVGYYRLITENLEDLLVVLTNPSHIIFAPNYPNITFNPDIMQDLNLWLQTDGDNIIYLYGSQDPWSAAAVEIGSQTNALKFIEQGKNHFLIIGDLQDSILVYNAIEGWFAASRVENNSNSPKLFQLYQNYPNPFNPSTKISFQIPEQSIVTIKVYDVLGNEISTLVNVEKSPGDYEVHFDASLLPSGVYFYQLQAGEVIQTKRMILIR